MLIDLSAFLSLVAGRDCVTRERNNIGVKVADVGVYRVLCWPELVYFSALDFKSGVSLHKASIIQSFCNASGALRFRLASNNEPKLR